MSLFKIVFEGRDITERIAAHLISISLDDKRGSKADDLNIRLEDAAGVLALPKPGSRIQFFIGAASDSLIYKGIFTIDEIEDGGPPDYMEIRATSADFTQNLKIRKERFFENQTIGDIVNFISGEHDLTGVVSENFAGVVVPHISQTNESDLNLLSRIAKEYGGFFALKNMTLIFSDESGGKSASGKALPVYTLDRRDTASYRFNERSRKQDFTGAKAAWFDVDNSEKKWELSGAEGKVKSLPEIYQNSETALKAASAAFERAARGKLSMSITLSTGDASLIPERPVLLTGFKEKIGGVDWIISNVQLSLGNNVFSTSFELEPLS